jgi:hypothetical protein
MLDWLPSVLQKLVRDAFVDGHSVPSARPSAKDWSDRLHQVEKELIGCRRNGSHAHFGHFPHCPACQAEAVRKTARKQTRKGAAPASPAQRPMPGIRPRLFGLLWRRLTTPIVLLSAMLLAYNWSDLKPQPGQRLMQEFVQNQANHAFASNLKERWIPEQRQARQLESGSEIYRKLIGSSPNYLPKRPPVIPGAWHVIQ